MSESYANERALGAGEMGERWRSATTTVVGVSLLTMLLAATNVVNWVATDGSLASVAVTTLYATALLVSGVLLVAVGVASSLNVVSTDANDRAGSLSGLPIGAVVLVVVGLVCSQTLGYGAIVWAPAALVGGVVAFFLGSLAREDLAATLPWGLLAVLVSLLLFAGVVTPEWQWSPQDLGFAFKGIITIPVLAFVTSLFTAWAAAKATQGFGARGRQTGAYLLIGTNALFMLMLLFFLVAFVTQKGAPRALEGAHLGPGISIHVPFVMNSANPFGVSGILPAIVGTFWLVVGALLFSAPLGVGAAVFLAEYAEIGAFTTVVDIATDGLWSTPSIVYGLFGFAFLLPRLTPNGTPSLLAGMLVLGFMLIPLILITSREAIQSVPDGYRDASVALGVNRWQTIRSVVLPAAIPGILTGIILGVGRIAGETAPLLLVAVHDLSPSDYNHVISSFRFTASPPFVANDALLSSTTALPYQIYAVIETGVAGKPEFGWATAFVLLLVVICLYAVGIATRMYFQRKLEQ
ncbi:MAG: phosphate ABC transporter permease PstA [Haloarculaceae archaeon]